MCSRLDFRPLAVLTAAAVLVSLTVVPTVSALSSSTAGSGPDPLSPRNLTFSVTIRNLRFLNTSISADPGDNVTLTITNEDPFPHTFTLFARVNVTPPWSSTDIADMTTFNASTPKIVDVIFTGAGTQVVSFTAPSTVGRFAYVCMITGHWLTMQGWLQVGEVPSGPPGPALGIIPGIMVATIVFVLLFAAGYHLRAVRAQNRDR